jgi:Fe-S cluster assembly iron-binding protein IscA
MFMLTVTDNARAHLTQLIEESNAPEDMAIRFVLDDKQIAPKLDSVHTDDATFDHNGRTVLILDENISQALTSHTLDVQDTDAGPRLMLS